LKRLLKAWKNARQTFARIEADRRARVLAEWQHNYPKEYALWLSAGRPAVFIYRQLD